MTPYCKVHFLIGKLSCYACLHYDMGLSPPALPVRCVGLLLIVHCFVVGSETRTAGRVVRVTADSVTHSRTTARSACVPVSSAPWCDHGYGLRVGDYNISICNITAWTYRDLWFQGAAILTPTGFTTTVANVNIPPNTGSHVWPPLRQPACPVIRQATYNTSGFLGTGHGGEYVFAVTLEVGRGPSGRFNLLSGEHAQRHPSSSGSSDGGVPPIPPAGITFEAGTPLSVIKESQIGPFTVLENTTLTSSGLVVTVNGTVAYANSGPLVNFMYPCMTMFARPYRQWIAAAANGTELRGHFLADDSMTLNQDIRWAAVFTPGTEKGSLREYNGRRNRNSSSSIRGIARNRSSNNSSRLLATVVGLHGGHTSARDGTSSKGGMGRGAVYQYPVDDAYSGYHGAGNFFWNRPYDHKLYFKIAPPTGLGSVFAYTLAVQGFHAIDNEWEQAAKRLVRWPTAANLLRVNSSTGDVSTT